MSKCAQKNLTLQPFFNGTILTMVCNFECDVKIGVVNMGPKTCNSLVLGLECSWCTVSLFVCFLSQQLHVLLRSCSCHTRAMLVLLPVDQCSFGSCFYSIYRYCTCTVPALFTVDSLFSGFVQIKYFKTWGIWPWVPINVGSTPNLQLCIFTRLWLGLGS